MCQGLSGNFRTAGLSPVCIVGKTDLPPSCHVGGSWQASERNPRGRSGVPPIKDLKEYRPLTLSGLKVVALRTSCEKYQAWAVKGLAEYIGDLLPYHGPSV